MDTFSLPAGTALPLTVTLTSGQGQPVGSYSGATPLQAEVWPGGSRAQSFAVDAAWLDPAAGQVSLLVAPGDTATLPAGRYRGHLLILDPVAGWLIGYEWWIDLQAVPGIATEPPSYCSYGDLLTYGRAWLTTLATEDTEAGFAEERGRARSWLDDLILAHFPRNCGSWNQPGTAGYQPFLGLFGGQQGVNPYLRSLLDSDSLLVRGWVIEATAKRALAFICEAQVGFGESSDQYRRLGARYTAESASLANQSRAEIGYPQTGTNLSGITIVGNPPEVFGEVIPMFTVNLGGGSVR